MSTVRCVFVFLFFVSGLACEREPDRQGEAPPPLVTARTNVCEGRASAAADEELERLRLGQIGGYCEDPHAELKAYGENAQASLDDVCLQLFNGECELYKSYGLLRVNTARYVHAGGSPAAVNVYVSRFSSSDGAYGFFSKRLVAGADPKQLSLRRMQAGVEAALGSGVAYVYSGHSVAELSYANELETPEQMRQSADKVLPVLGQALGVKLGAQAALPSAVRLLPTEHRLPFGVKLSYQDALSVAGAGAGAVGFYEQQGKRYRVLVAERTDGESAKDTFKTLRRSSGARSLKDMPYDAFELALPGSPGAPATTWLVAGHGNLVVAVGDEAFAMKSRMTDDEKSALCLTRAAKLKLIQAVFKSQSERKKESG